MLSQKCVHPPLIKEGSFPSTPDFPLQTMLFGLTLLELCDFVAGCGYSVQLAFMPEDVRPTLPRPAHGSPSQT